MESDSLGVISDIAGHRAEIGFAGTRIRRPHCEYFPFFEDELILVAPNREKYRMLRERGGGMEWLREEAFVLREDGSGTRREAMKHLREAGIREESLKIVASFGNTDAVLLSVKEGVGVSVTSRLAAQEKIDRGELLDFRLSAEGCFRKLYMVTGTERPATDAAQKLVRLVKNLYAGQEKETERIENAQRVCYNKY